MIADRRRLIIFDVDGTLVDSQEAIVAALSMAFEAEGLDPLSRERFLSIVGLSLDEVFADLVPGASIAQRARLVAGYKDAYLRMRSEGRAEAEAPMFPGTRDLILSWHDRGTVLAVATGKARRGVAHFLDRHDLNGRFSVIQTADDAPSKPHPQMVLNCLSGTDVKPEDAVIVGDTEFDMAMGVAAGVRRIGVGWGYHPIDRVTRGGAEVIARDVCHLDQLLHEIW